MAHGMTENDSFLAYKHEGWHKLGSVSLEELSPNEAYQKSGMAWEVDMQPAFLAGGLEVMNTSVCVRKDNNLQLGVHGSDYTPMQNSELFDLAYSLDKDVKVETCLTIHNCRKVVVLLRGETIKTGKNDAMDTYIALLNSFDGTMPTTAMPTSTRIVCQNTLNLAMSAGKDKMFKVRHTKNHKDRVAEMQKALQRYVVSGSMFREKVETLANRKATQEKLLKFWSDAYLTAIDKTTLKEEEVKESLEVMDKWSVIMETEMMELGENEPSMWLAANAVTNWIQHKEPGRVTENWQENRFFENTIGKNDSKSAAIMNMALAF